MNALALTEFTGKQSIYIRLHGIGFPLQFEALIVISSRIIATVTAIATVIVTLPLSH